MSKTTLLFDDATRSRIIEMAWDDRISFDGRIQL
jgi:hypothetical protein